MKIRTFFNSIIVLAVTLLITTSQQAYNQVSISSGLERTFTDFTNLHSKNVFKAIILTENDIEGSAYLDDHFVLGDIITYENVIYKDIPLRYNIYNDQMEFQISLDIILSISNPEILKEIQFGDQVFIYCEINDAKGGYFSLKQSGNIQLLSKYNIDFLKAELPAPFKEAKPPSFRSKPNTFFIKIDEGYPVQISKKKNLVLIFGSLNDEIQKFIKKEKINLKRENDLIELVQFANNYINK